MMSLSAPQAPQMPGAQLPPGYAGGVSGLGGGMDPRGYGASAPPHFVGPGGGASLAYGQGYAGGLAPGAMASSGNPVQACSR